MTSGWCSGPTGARPHCDRCRSERCDHDCHEEGRIVTSNATSGGGKVRNPWDNRDAPEGASTPHPGLDRTTSLEGSASRG